MVQAVRDLFQIMKDVQAMKNDELRERLTDNTDANNFVMSLDDYAPPTTYQQRLVCYQLAKIYEKLSSL